MLVLPTEDNLRNVRLGLAGCGRLAQRTLARTLRDLSGGTVVAAADPDPRCRAAVQAFIPRLSTYADYRDLLEDRDVEAVVIALPPALHAEAAVAALRAGKHVYIEKPIAIELPSARTVVEEQERTGLVAMLGFNLRYHPLYRRLAEEVAGGRPGQVMAGRTAFCAATRALPDWKTTRGTGGGALLDLGSHHIDLVRFVFRQEVSEVSAWARSVRTELDTVWLELRLEHGPVVQSLFSLTAAEQDRFEVHGDAGWLGVDRYRSRKLQYVPARRPASAGHRLRQTLELLGHAPGRLHDALRPPPDPSQPAALAHFIAAVRRGVPAGIHLADGVSSLLVVAAAEASIERGRPVPVQELAAEWSRG